MDDIERFYDMLDFISDNIKLDYELTSNSVFYIQKKFDKYSNEEVDIYFQFSFTKKLNCYNFKSEFYKSKILNNNFIDFILDIYNIMTFDKKTILISR